MSPMEEERPQFFMLDEGTEDFYNFKDWRLDDEEEATAEDDVDLKKVIIVDASPFFRNMLKTHLESAGFKVTGLYSCGQEACASLAQAPVKFAAVDIDQTDGGNGKTVQVIAAAHPHTAFLLTSSRFSKEQVAQGGVGTYFFIAKPLTKEAVEKTMKKAYDREIAKKAPADKQKKT